MPAVEFVVNQALFSNQAVYFNLVTKAGTMYLHAGHRENARKLYERSNRALRLMRYGLDSDTACRAADALEIALHKNMVNMIVAQRRHSGSSQESLFVYAVGQLIASRH